MNTESNAYSEQFAKTANNRAWDLAVQNRTPAEDREMLDAAHASAWHWNAIGAELNKQRAVMLLAEVHALLGLGDSALAYAGEMRDYFLNRQTPDWELAFTHAIYAHAALAAGKIDEYRAAYQQSAQAIASIADEEDRKIVMQTFEQIPTA